MIGKLSPSGEMDSAPMADEKDVDGPGALHGIAEDVLMAIDKKSASDLAQALQALADYVEMGSYDDESEG